MGGIWTFGFLSLLFREKYQKILPPRIVRVCPKEVWQVFAKQSITSWPTNFLKIKKKKMFKTIARTKPFEEVYKYIIARKKKKNISFRLFFRRTKTCQLFTTACCQLLVHKIYCCANGCWFNIIYLGTFDCCCCCCCQLLVGAQNLLLRKWMVRLILSIWALFVVVVVVVAAVSC